MLRRVGKIPRGRVTTYSALARALGRPGAARAVGNALNKNPHLGAVPCHRVVRSDGRVGGYARGAKKKAALLRAEGVIMRGGMCGFGRCCPLTDITKSIYFWYG